MVSALLEFKFRMKACTALVCVLLISCCGASLCVFLRQWWRFLINGPPDVCEAYLWQWGILALPATLSWKGGADRNPDTETLSSTGSGDSSGIIRINAEKWNKEMSHHNTDQLFISILCFTRWISWVIMDRQGWQSLLLVMTDTWTSALVLYAAVDWTMRGKH